MQTINSLPAGAEWPLHDCRGGHLDEKLAHLALQARKRFLPQHSFRKCAALRGTLGQQSPVGSVGEESYLLLWEKSKKPKWIYFVCVQDIDRLLDAFTPTNWSFLHFWKDGDGAASRMRISPPPGLAPRPSNDLDAPMGPGPGDGPTLVLDEDAPAGHHLVQPALPPPPPGTSDIPMEPDVPMPANPQPHELGGGSSQPPNGGPPRGGGPNQNLGGATSPRKPVIETGPPKHKPDKSLRFSFDPNARPPKPTP